MNRTGDVTRDGRYLSHYKEQSKKFGAEFGTLSAGRVGIMAGAVARSRMALTIAVR